MLDFESWISKTMGLCIAIELPIVILMFLDFHIIQASPLPLSKGEGFFK
jgi:hypothetical protein